MSGDKINLKLEHRLTPLIGALTSEVIRQEFFYFFQINGAPRKFAFFCKLSENFTR